MTGRVVLDASAAVRVVLQGLWQPELSAFLAESPMVVAPGLLCAEVANSLWKYVRAGTLPAQEAQERLAEALALADTLVPDRILVEEALAAATQRNSPVYDLLYAVLARRHGATVVTADEPFARRLAAMEIACFCPALQAG
ncbi:MAG TPA: type II toxin-antitoxin system VapC family toxin [Thermoanaerobaculia bacterium]|nr:type II toxin-antitoxin system VapC family toxin [Thermoanaerobaculia bacterium]